MKILIIEDELLIQKALQKLISAKGHSVDATSFGIEAIEKIKENSYDRIICDIMLKDITGFEVIEESKQIMTAEEIGQTFIIITAYSSEQIINNAKKYQCIIINKPFENISETVNKMIQGINN